MSRNFQRLKGATIVEVDSTCVNQLVLRGDDDRIYTIVAEVHDGIPTMTLTTRKNKRTTKTTQPKTHDYD